MKAIFYGENGTVVKRNVTAPGMGEHVCFETGGTEYLVKNVLHDFDAGLFRIFLEEVKEEDRLCHEGPEEDQDDGDLTGDDENECEEGPADPV